MPTEVAMFWLIHLAICIVLPVLIFRGCCGMEPLIKDNTAADERPINQE
jgi:hypothetical protein